MGHGQAAERRPLVMHNCRMCAPCAPIDRSADSGPLCVRVPLRRGAGPAALRVQAAGCAAAASEPFSASTTTIAGPTIAIAAAAAAAALTATFAAAAAAFSTAALASTSDGASASAGAPEPGLRLLVGMQPARRRMPRRLWRCRRLLPPGIRFRHPRMQLREIWLPDQSLLHCSCRHAPTTSSAAAASSIASAITVAPAIAVAASSSASSATSTHPAATSAATAASFAQASVATAIAVATASEGPASPACARQPESGVLVGVLPSWRGVPGLLRRSGGMLPPRLRQMEPRMWQRRPRLPEQPLLLRGCIGLMRP